MRFINFFVTGDFRINLLHVPATVALGYDARAGRETGLDAENVRLRVLQWVDVAPPLSVKMRGADKLIQPGDRLLDLAGQNRVFQPDGKMRAHEICDQVLLQFFELVALRGFAESSA